MVFVVQQTYSEVILYESIIIRAFVIHFFHIFVSLAVFVLVVGGAGGWDGVGGGNGGCEDFICPMG